MLLAALAGDLSTPHHTEHEIQVIRIAFVDSGAWLWVWGVLEAGRVSAGSEVSK
jgi:hypothetical protein